MAVSLILDNNLGQATNSVSRPVDTLRNSLIFCVCPKSMITKRNNLENSACIIFLCFQPPPIPPPLA